VSTPFAAIETRLGQKAAALLADATLTGGGGLSVDGIFDESHSNELDMRARRVRFVAPEGTAADDLVEGAAVTVTKNAAATNYLVAIDPIVSGGQCEIELRKASIP
jgi:hypothetical protein